jgi:hypothetical protein
MPDDIFITSFFWVGDNKFLDVNFKLILAET